MLSRVFSSVPESWNNCPTTTNAVERKNYESKTDRPQPLKLAMINLYKLDKSTCCKHIASESGSSISYRSRDEEARKQSAANRCRQRAIAFHADKMALHGPPDRCSNFNSVEGSKRKNETNRNNPVKKLKLSVDNTTLTFTKNPNPEVMGKKVKVKFMVKELKREEWFVGIISSYNGLKGEYGIHFPCDNKTVNMKLDDDDLVFLEE